MSKIPKVNVSGPLVPFFYEHRHGDGLVNLLRIARQGHPRV